MQLSELFDRQTWMLARIALRRAHKDRRARKLLGSILLWFLSAAAAPVLIVGVAATALVAPGSLGGLPIFIGLAIGLAIRAVRVSARRNSEFKKAAQDVPIAVRQRIYRTTYWLANLMRRCESEFALLKEMPPNIEIVTRRLMLDRLKAREIWEEMPLVVRDLLLKPDGHWTDAERNQVADKFEFLVCLRWITQKDKVLPVLALAPVYKGIQAQEIAADTGWFRNEVTVAPSQIDAHLKRTAGFLERCGREGVARSLFPADEDKRELAVEQNRKMDARARAEDWLVGSQTVGEISDQELRQAHRRALLRFRLLRSVLEEMTSSAPKETLHDLIAASLSLQIKENNKLTQDDKT